jgi:hypothetical protein
MKLLNLALFAIPAFLFAREPLAPGDETPAVDSSAAARDPLTAEQKVTRRALRLVEPVTLFSSAFGAGIEQLRNMPPQWGQGSEGYARRFASAEGYTAAHNVVALGFDLAFHLDPRYRRMPRGGLGPRLWNAVSQTFIANTDSGGKMINVSEIAGNFGAGFVSNAWQPAGHNSTGDALTRAAFGLAYHTARNAAREFLPDLLHHARHKRSSEQDPD